jgi:hypothetical protein
MLRDLLLRADWVWIRCFRSGNSGEVGSWYLLRAQKRFELLFHTHTSVECGKLLGYFFWPEHLEFFSCTQF